MRTYRCAEKDNQARGAGTSKSRRRKTTKQADAAGGSASSGPPTLAGAMQLLPTGPQSALRQVLTREKEKHFNDLLILLPPPTTATHLPIQQAGRSTSAKPGVWQGTPPPPCITVPSQQYTRGPSIRPSATIQPCVQGGSCHQG